MTKTNCHIFHFKFQRNIKRSINAILQGLHYVKLIISSITIVNKTENKMSTIIIILFKQNY